MYKNKTFLAIIPARGGSKRITRKNISKLNGKPLIEWTINAGLKSRYIDKVLVTSDDDDILQISKELGSCVVKRPDGLASDTSTTFDVVQHAVNNYTDYDYIILLQPTSPLRAAAHIDESIRFLFQKKADAIISVCKVDHSPLWSNTLPSDCSMSNFIEDSVLCKRSQDLDTFYRLNGAIYICNKTKLLERRSFCLRENIFAFKMERDVSIDIDEPIDFKIASALLEQDCK